jgi:mono/diheme cytochrome c family protein
MKYLAGAMTAILIALAGAIAYSYSGIYNVAATEPHTPWGAWFLDNTMHHSVRVRASDIDAPSQLTTAQAQAGANHFRTTCAPCHGAPGTHGEAGGDMRPEPPALRVAAEEWSSSEIFWIVKNGIKMTAMPFFSSSHSDAEIWEIVAFLETLPQMSPERYAQVTSSGTPDVRLSVFGKDDVEGAAETSENAEQSVTSPTRAAEPE